MFARLLLYGALLVAVAVVVGGACTTVSVPSPSPSAAALPTPTRTPLPPPSLARGPSPSPAPSPAPTPTPSAAAPGTTPAPACPRQTGGAATNQAQLVDIRVAHHSETLPGQAVGGFDRVVFEFARSTAPGGFGLPSYVVEIATSLRGASGQPVPIEGSALTLLRLQNTSTRNPDGTASYSGSTDLHYAGEVREVKLVDDFERVMTWGIGLTPGACPRALELADPFRIVLDFPTPP